MTQSPTSVVELHITCQDLKNKDTFSKSDPFAILFVQENKQWVKIGQTEVIQDNLNPRFAKALKTDYFFEENQSMKLQVFDHDQHTAHDLIGEAEFLLGQLMASPGQQLKLTLRNKKSILSSKSSQGTVQIQAEELSACSDFLQVQFAASKLDNKDGFFGKSDPFLVIERVREDGSWTKVWQSETIDNNLNPVWKATEIAVLTLCNGDYNRPLKFRVFDDDGGGKHDFIGEFETTLDQLMEGSGTGPLAFINPERQRKKGKKYQNSGTLLIKKLQIVKHPTFVEYLKGGCELNLIIGVDYTASNGTPFNPSSPQAMNQYQHAIAAAGSILQEYDTDKKFPVYGFGGKIGGQVSHCFPLTMNPAAPEIQGIPGVLQFYANSLQAVALSGPTLFTPLIQQASYLASQYNSQTHQKYFVLLILTDGVIMDMQQTIDSLVNASRLPLSVVIVGVGNADFSAMNALDCDDGLLKASNGSKAVRDIVQFVPFSKVMSSSAGRLSKEILAEIPNQLVQYMKSANFTPNPALAATNKCFDPTQASPIEQVLPPSPVITQQPSAPPLQSQHIPPPVAPTYQSTV